MNDPKAASAYHPGDGAVRRADLDALIEESEALATGSPQSPHQWAIHDLVVALTQEQARADQAEQRIADAPHAKTCYLEWYSGPDGQAVTPCTCWKSAAPTAEQ